MGAYFLPSTTFFPPAQETSTLERLKEGLDSVQKTFFQVVLQIKEEKQAEGVRKAKVEQQIHAAKARAQGRPEYKVGVARLGGGCLGVALAPFTVDMGDEEEDLMAPLL